MCPVKLYFPFCQWSKKTSLRYSFVSFGFVFSKGEAVFFLGGGGRWQKKNVSCKTLFSLFWVKRLSNWFILCWVFSKKNKCHVKLEFHLEVVKNLSFVSFVFDSEVTAFVSVLLRLSFVSFGFVSTEACIYWSYQVFIHWNSKLYLHV